MATSGFQRALLLRGLLPGLGRKALPDGLDRSIPDGTARLVETYLSYLSIRNQSLHTIATRRRALVAFCQWANLRKVRANQHNACAPSGTIPSCQPLP